MKFLVALLTLVVAMPLAFSAEEILKYTVAETPWEESLGSQRAVLKIDKPELAHVLHLRWRRHDSNPEDRCFIILNAKTGKRIENIHRIHVDNERCIISFGPTLESGEYYFYYLPYEPQKAHGWYQKNYLKKEPPFDERWMQTSHIADKGMPTAEVIRIESRTAHDSFAPMEITATKREIEEFKKTNPQDYYVFLEDRHNPVKMRNTVPVKWIRGDTAAGTIPEVRKNEYFTFQVAVWAGTKNLEDVKIEWQFPSINPSKITCFNTEGINPRGEHFTKRVDVPAGKVQAFWIGVDIAKDQACGEYAGKVIVTPKSGASTSIPVKFRVIDSVAEDRGDDAPENMTRLRWLNSTLGISDEPIAPYPAIKKSGENTFEVLTRKITLDDNSPFVRQIEANEEKLFSERSTGVNFDSGIGSKKYILQSEKLTNGSVERVYVARENSELNCVIKMRMEFDGWTKYSITLEAKKDSVKINPHLDFELNDSDLDFMGFGFPGGKFPQKYQASWRKNLDGGKFIKPFDSFWVGTANVGVHCEFLGASYHGPLLNLYRPAPPPTWDNNSNGKLSVTANGKDASVKNTIRYSVGEMELKKGVPATFEFALLPTPIKPLDTHGQFTNRYYHNGGRPKPSLEDFAAGVRIVNVHHANSLNPIINYPFITVPAFKKFAAECHEKNAKVKIYYTVRELTTALPELWALRSLGNEIFAAGKGGNGFPWLREHLVDDYYTQWYAPLNGEFDKYVVADAALLTAPGESRWLNYYVEGLRWLCQNADIDGIYMDDVSFDRNMLKRMRRAMAAGGKADGLIDLHSNTGFSIGPAIQYTDFFPYVDKVWFGESFRYNEMSPENWLVECSGIPFGLMGDTLQNGGNPWLSMQYGMTTRYPWGGTKSEKDPRNMWTLWDKFGIADSKMIGWWDAKCPVKIRGTSKDLADNVKATIYQKQNSALISIGNYSNANQEFSLDLDWEKLGIEQQSARIIAPKIANMQEAKTFPLNAKFSVPAKRGILLIIKKSDE